MTKDTASRSNSQRALCCHCRRPVLPHQGHWVGPGLVRHNEQCQPSALQQRMVDARPSKRLKQLARDFLAPAFLAVAVVGAASAAGTGDNDYVLLVPGEEPICAKSEADCQQAIRAIRNGWWLADPTNQRGDKPITCEPHPGCFDARSLCIKGYNCR